MAYSRPSLMVGVEMGPSKEPFSPLNAGPIGKLQMVRVMLKFNVSELVDMDPDTELPADLASKLMRYKDEIQKG